jgi:hypothetical protein
MSPSHSCRSAGTSRISRCLQSLLGAFDVRRDVAVCDRIAHDEIDVGGKDFSKFIKEPEVRIYKRKRIHGAEFDQEVHVALAQTEIVPQRGTEGIEARHAKASACLRDCLTLVLKHTNHVTSFSTTVPRYSRADNVKAEFRFARRRQKVKL